MKTQLIAGLAISVVGVLSVSAAPAFAGEQELGHIQRVNTSVLNIDGQTWGNFEIKKSSFQVDLQSDRSAVIGFDVSGNINNPTFKVVGSAGTPNPIDPITGLNISIANSVETGGSNFKIGGVQTETTFFGGVRGIQTGTGY
jgi:hypothetical protein